MLFGDDFPWRRHKHVPRYTKEEYIQSLERSLRFLAKKGTGAWKRAATISVKVPDTFNDWEVLPLEHKGGVMFVEVYGERLKYTPSMLR